MQLLAGWGVADGGGEAMGGLTAVNLIAKDRVTQMLEMDANLMGSTGVKVERQIAGMSPKRLKCPIVSDGMATVVDNRHGLSVVGMACNGSIDPAFRTLWDAAGNGQVLFLDGALGELFGQALMGTIRLGHDQTATGICRDDAPHPVEPPHQCR